MSNYRQIHTKFWNDAWVQDLLPEEKLLFIYLFSNEHASICGLYELSLKTMGFETGLRPDAISLALDRFSKAGKVFYEAPYIWVPNLRRYNESSSIKIAARIASDLALVPDCELKRAYQRHYAGGGGNKAGPPSLPEMAQGTVSIPYPQLHSEKEKEKEFEQEKGRGIARAKTPTPRPCNHAPSKIVKDEVGTWPTRAMQDEIENIVGGRPEDLRLWQRIVHEWIAIGRKKGNLRGMLDCFVRQEVPTTGLQAGAAEPKGFAAVREALAEANSGK